MTVEINPMTTDGAVFKRMNMMLMGIQRTAKMIVVLSHSFEIFYFLAAGMSSSAWFFETKGKMGLMMNR